MGRRGGDMIEELTSDHNEVEEIFGRIEALPVGDKQRKMYVDQAVIQLVRHSVAEEEYLYPAVREHLPDGDTVADKEIADHADAERTIEAPCDSRTAVLRVSYAAACNSSYSA